MIEIIISFKCPLFSSQVSYFVIRSVMKRNVSIVKDINGNNVVVINNVQFKGKRSVKWNDVKLEIKKETSNPLES